MSGKLTIGLNCKLYYNAGTYLAPTWTLISTAKDVKLNLGKSVGDAGSRLSTWKMVLPALKEASIEYEILADTSLTFTDVLRTDYVSDTVVDVAVADGLIATTGTEYFRADTIVSGFTRTEPLEGASTYSVKHELAYSTDAQQFVTVP